MHANDAYRTRTELENAYRESVETARLRHRSAELKYHDVLGLQLGLTTPYEPLAIRAARREEAAALAHYRRQLRIFTDLILTGKVPRPDSGIGKTASGPSNCDC